jgi:hypothetical protein
MELSVVLVPTAMRDKIMCKWLSSGGEDSNPIEKILFSVQQLGNQLMLVPLSMGRAVRDEGEGGATLVAGSPGNVVAGGGECPRPTALSTLSGLARLRKKRSMDF